MNNEKKPVQDGNLEQDTNSENSNILLSTNVSVPQIDADSNSQSGVNKAPVQSTTGKSKKTRGKKVTQRMLYANSKTRTMSVKFYEEQIPFPFTIQSVIEQVRLLVSELPHLQVILAMHNRDVRDSSEDVWAPATEKRHYHLIIRGLNGYQFQVLSMLKRLCIHFRQGVDDDLWKNKGIETVGNYSAYALYLTHETEDALSNGAKYTYDLDEMWKNGEASSFPDSYLDSCNGLIVANMSLDALKEIRAGYIRVNSRYSKLSIDDKRKIDAELFELGYRFGNFDEWLDAQDFVVRADAKRKVYEESYARGANRRRDEMEANGEVLNRVCIFIQGVSGSGKSYASLNTLKQMKLKVLSIEGGGTGKYDKLKPDHDALLVNDDTVRNALNICDDKIVNAYKRQANNPLWCGEWVVITSNKTFDEWITDCGITNPENQTAMYERCFRCHMVERAGVYYLELDKANSETGYAIPSRGDAKKIQVLVNRFAEFQEIFNSISSSYVKATSAVLDLSKLNSSVAKELSTDDAIKKWHDMAMDFVSDIQSKTTAKVSLGFDEIALRKAYKNRDTTILNKVPYSVNGEWDFGTIDFIR